jgi:hypothetical protein
MARGVLVSAFIPLTVRFAALPLNPIPLPAYHDEFSYLLAGDTFSHGRLINLPHPFWQFFESFHILQQPTYMSMYPPGQGLTLAFGKILFGHPWWGVFLSFGTMCALLFWACRGWLSPGWSLLGAVLTGLNVGSTYWLNSYWGGTVAAVGGCLVVGSVIRIIGARPEPGGKFLLGALLGLGISILANSRPWEGMWLILGVGVVLAYRWYPVRSFATGREMLRALPACVGVLAVAGIMMIFYCWRVTGNPLQLPYTLDRATYAVAPLFIWQKPSPPKVYRHAVMKKFYLEWEPSFQGADTYSSSAGFIKGILLRAKVAGQTLFGRPDWPTSYDYLNVEIGIGAIFGLLVLLFARSLFAKPSVMMLLVCLCVAAVGTAIQRYFLPHYFAPLLTIAVVLKMMSVRHFYCLRWKGTRIGMALAPTLLVVNALAAISGYGFTGYLTHHKARQSGFASQRDTLIQKLRKEPGRHLVLVRYSNQHNLHDEWVYNGADIDASDIVWAREMSEEQNQKLAAYFSGRRIWLLEADSNGPAFRRLY